MAVNEYDIGDRVRLSATFTDSTGAFLDPPKVSFQVNSPATSTLLVETTTGTEVAHPSTGLYTLVVDVDNPGSWTWRVFSTGTNAAAGESWFRVSHSLVTT